MGESWVTNLLRCRTITVKVPTRIFKGPALYLKAHSIRTVSPCVRSSMAAVFCFGRNHCGQLGRSADDDSNIPSLVMKLADDEAGMRTVYCGADCTMAASGELHGYKAEALS